MDFKNMNRMECPHPSSFTGLRTNPGDGLVGSKNQSILSLSLGLLLVWFCAHFKCEKNISGCADVTYIQANMVILKEQAFSAMTTDQPQH